RYPSAVVLLQFGDKLPRPVCAVCGAGPGLLIVVQGGSGVLQSVPDPTVISKQDGDVLAGPPRCVNVSPDFMVLDGLLVVAERLAGLPRPAVNVAEFVLGDAARFVVVKGGEVHGLLVAAQCGVEVFQQHRL